MQVSLQEQIHRSDEVIREAYERFLLNRMAVAWTGGKDSTPLLCVLRQYALGQDLPLPQLVLIDEGHVFGEVKDFVARIAAEWDVEAHEVKNEDMLAQAQRIGDRVYVDRLNTRDQG